MRGLVKIEKARLQLLGVFVVVLLLHLSVAAAILLTPKADLAASTVDVAVFEMVDVSLAEVKPVVVAAKTAEVTAKVPVKSVTPPPQNSPKPVVKPAPLLPVVTTDVAALFEPVTAAPESSEAVIEQVAAVVAVSTAAVDAVSVDISPSPSAAPSAPVSTADDFISPDLAAAYRTNPPPPYPLMARRRGLEGVVILMVLLDEGGRPLHVDVKESSGHGILDETAVQSVRNWRFVPAQRGGRSVEAEVEVPLRFALR